MFDKLASLLSSSEYQHLLSGYANNPWVNIVVFFFFLQVIRFLESYLPIDVNKMLALLATKGPLLI